MFFKEEDDTSSATPEDDVIKKLERKDTNSPVLVSL